jgi:hypothetical protein
VVGEGMLARLAVGTTYRFIEAPGHSSTVLDWFRSLPRPPAEHPSARGIVLHFQELGPLAQRQDGTLDPARSPVATLFLPRVRRGVLWTVGEVHFLATPLRRLFPELHRISARFKKWLATHECVYPGRTPQGSEWDYTLEGSIKNYEPPVFAFPSGLEALRSGQYFVAEDDNEFVLDKLCAALRLRGIDADPGA